MCLCISERLCWSVWRCVYLSLSITSVSLLIAEWTPCRLHGLYCDYHPHTDAHTHMHTDILCDTHKRRDTHNEIFAITYSEMWNLSPVFQEVSVYGLLYFPVSLYMCVRASVHLLSVCKSSQICVSISVLCYVCVPAACLSSAPALNEYVSAAHVNC